MTKLPRETENKWLQPNNSDKFGSVAFSKNLNFDSEGYVSLSPRAVKLYGDADNADFGLPVAIGRQSATSYQMATTSDANFTVDIDTQQKTFTENSGSNEPTLTFNSDATWFAGLWHASTATAVLSRAASGSGSAAWTSRITGLTSGVEHILEVFSSRNSLCVANGNVVKQYNSSYASTVDLTIPADFFVSCLAYNNSQMAVGTRLNNDGTYGQDNEARLFVWNGASTGASRDAGVGSDAILAVEAYLSSFVLLNRAGELLYWNGGGFTRLASLPFYFTDNIWNSSTVSNALGRIHMQVDGDVVYLNLGLRLNDFGRKAQESIPTSPSGVWCYDPKVGLYHRYSPSISSAYVNHVSSADVNTGTDEMTISAGTYGLQTIPATGGIARLTETAGIGGLTLNDDYYIIKTSATTFKLATTKDNAINGVAIDLTSATSGSNYFWMYDLVDYGQALYDYPGAISLVGGSSMVMTDVVLGGRLNDTTVTAIDCVSGVVPELENVGFLVTPRRYSTGITDSNTLISIKYSDITSTDSIIIKYRTNDVAGLPTATGTGTEGNWTSDLELYSDQDLSEAYAYLNAGGSLELEVLSGAGAGSLVQVESMGYDSSTGRYSFVLKESVLGAGSGLKCEFVVDNWAVHETITTDSKNYGTGVYKSTLSSKSRFIQFKIILKGVRVTLEEIEFATKQAERTS